MSCTAVGFRRADNMRKRRLSQPTPWTVEGKNAGFEQTRDTKLGDFVSLSVFTGYLFTAEALEARVWALTSSQKLSSAPNQSATSATRRTHNAFMNTKVVHTVQNENSS